MNTQIMSRKGITGFALILSVFASCTCKQLCKSNEKDKKSNTPSSAAVATDTVPQNSATISAETQTPKTETMPVQENYRLVISFISIGSGINLPAKEKLDNYLQLNETLKMKNPEIEIARWGREGEVDYCMKLSAFSAADQEKIVKGIKEQLKKQDHIFLDENAPCRHKRTGR